MTDQRADKYATLRSRAVSKQAFGLVNLLYANCTHWELVEGHRTRDRSDTKAMEFRETIERTTAELLLAKADPEETGAIWRRLDYAEFRGSIISYRDFRAAIAALHGLRFVRHQYGASRYMELTNDGVERMRVASRIAPTFRLLRLAKRFGVELSDIGSHFSSGVLQARGALCDGEKDN